MKKLERTYNIPLRNEWLKAPTYKRAKRAVSAVRIFLKKHMKSETIVIGNHLNEAIWKRGIQTPPHHIKVTAVKFDDDIVRAELVGIPIEEPKQEKKGKLETLKEKVTGKKEPNEEKKETKVEPEQKAGDKPKRANKATETKTETK